MSNPSTDTRRMSLIEIECFYEKPLLRAISSQFFSKITSIFRSHMVLESWSFFVEMSDRFFNFHESYYSSKTSTPTATTNEFCLKTHSFKFFNALFPMNIFLRCFVHSTSERKQIHQTVEVRQSDLSKLSIHARQTSTAQWKCFYKKEHIKDRWCVNFQQLSADIQKAVVLWKDVLFGQKTCFKSLSIVPP